MNNPTVGLIGCGRWGKLILRDLKSLSCKVPVVAASSESKANAELGRADEIFGSIKELSQKSVLDGVVVASPASTHYSVVRELLSLHPGLAVFCEKPLTLSGADSRGLLALQSDRIFVMDKWRYHPGVLKLAELVRLNTFGTLLGMRTERLGWGIPHNDTNAVWHLMPHDLSIVQEILGSIPDIRSSLIETADSQPIGALVTFGEAPWVTCHVSARSPVRRRLVQLVCEDAVVSLDDGYATRIRVARGSVNTGDSSPSVDEISIEDEMPLKRELSAFVEYLSAGGPAPKSPLRDAVRNVEVIEQILRGAGDHA